MQAYVVHKQFLSCACSTYVITLCGEPALLANIPTLVDMPEPSDVIVELFSLK